MATKTAAIGWSHFQIKRQPKNLNMVRPKIAIIEPNSLSALGLRQLLQTVMPVIAVDTFSSFTELGTNHPDQYVHFFVSTNIVLEHMSFFTEHRRKTIVLTLSLENGQPALSQFHCLCVNQPESVLIKSLLVMEQQAHGKGQHLPPIPPVFQQRILTDREVEVMSLIVQGFINKEIAEKLCIGLATVVTHRKNIMEKLGLKSVSALTIYAVTHGYVDINKI